MTLTANSVHVTNVTEEEYCEGWTIKECNGERRRLVGCSAVSPTFALGDHITFEHRRPARLQWRVPLEVREMIFNRPVRLSQKIDEDKCFEPSEKYVKYGLLFLYRRGVCGEGNFRFYLRRARRCFLEYGSVQGGQATLPFYSAIILLHHCRGFFATKLELDGEEWVQIHYLDYTVKPMRLEEFETWQRQFSIADIKQTSKKG